MPIQGQPPIYTRGYSFTTHSVQQPSVPQPGDKIDQELDDIATCIASGLTAIQGLVNPDGSLRFGLVTRDTLQPGLLDDIELDAAAALQPLVDAAAYSANGALLYAGRAQDSALMASAAAEVAGGAIHDVQEAAGISALAATSAEDAADDAAASAAAAANSASTAEDAMVNSLAHSETSLKWAEYLAGPVAPAPPGWPEAIDDGMWSAKWWAIRARELVGDWGTLYLGAFPSAPAPIPPATDYPLGSIYYDTTLGQMLVWNGSAWVPMTTPVAGAAATFVYLATNAQSVFSGPDMRGNTPVISTTTPQAVELHLNGVLLVQDTGNGTGDYTVNAAASSFTIKVALGSGSVVQVDLLEHPAVAAVGTAAYKLHDIDRDPGTNTPGEFDGVAVTFPLRYTSPVDATTKPAAPTDAVQLFIALGGVPQEAGPDFTTTASDITFAVPPQPGSRFSGVWHAPGAQA
jgi:hypothetical protein